MIKKILLSVMLFSLFFSGDVLVANGENDLSKPNYMINTSSLGLPSTFSDNGDATAEKTVNNVLGTIITKLMIAFGVLALFIMTVGGGYMIFAHGQDELLNKGKGIFTAGLISLIVALSAGIIMKLVIFLLHNNN